MNTSRVSSVMAAFSASILNAKPIPKEAGNDQEVGHYKEEGHDRQADYDKNFTDDA